jgi:hypothetical protein
MFSITILAESEFVDKQRDQFHSSETQRQTLLNWYEMKALQMHLENLVVKRSGHGTGHLQTVIDNNSQAKLSQREVGSRKS